MTDLEKFLDLVKDEFDKIDQNSDELNQYVEKLKSLKGLLNKNDSFILNLSEFFDIFKVAADTAKWDKGIQPVCQAGYIVAVHVFHPNKYDKE